MKKSYSVSEVAQLLGLSPQTIRKYEQAGLVKTSRKENNYRHFETPDITMLMRIRLFRNMGFSLETIRELVSPETDDRDEFYSVRLEELEAEKARLERIIECTKQHRAYCHQITGKLNQITIEPSPEIDYVLYRKWRSIEPEFLGNDRLASIIAHMPPFQYMIRLPKDSYTSGKMEYETGFAVPAQFRDMIPDIKGIQHLPSRICVSVLLCHDVKRQENGWEHLFYLPDDFRAVGVYDFMAQNALQLKGDIVGVTYFDTYGMDQFSHYIKYYFPVF